MVTDIKNGYDFYLWINDKIDNETTQNEWHLLQEHSKYGKFNNHTAAYNLSSKDAFYKWLWCNNTFDTPENRKVFRDIVIPILETFTPDDLLQGITFITGNYLVIPPKIENK